MKLIVALCFVAAVAASALTDTESDIRNGNEINYIFSYPQKQGQKRKEQEFLKNAADLENDSNVATGSFKWLAPDGLKYDVTYDTNEDVYQTEPEYRRNNVSAVVASLLGNG